MNQKTWALVSGATTEHGLPIHQLVGTAEGHKKFLRGYEVVINNALPDPTADNKAILFGDPGKITWREAGGFKLDIFRELYGLYHQIGCRVSQRFDSRLRDPQSFKYGKMAVS